MSTNNGFILLARKLLDSDVFTGPPLRVKLFIWLLLKANWKDRQKLKRGQLICTIAEMQKAMAWKVGFRTVTPTKAEIRGAYEALMKSTTIRTTKSTRGMIVTICNYDKYQAAQSYEAHNEDTMKIETTAQDTEEVKNEKREKDVKGNAGAERTAPASSPTDFCSDAVGKDCGLGDILLEIPMVNGTWRITQGYVNELCEQYNHKDIELDILDLQRLLLANPEHRPVSKGEVLRLVHDACQGIYPCDAEIPAFVLPTAGAPLVLFKADVAALEGEFPDLRGVLDIEDVLQFVADSIEDGELPQPKNPAKAMEMIRKVLQEQDKIQMEDLEKASKAV